MGRTHPRGPAYLPSYTRQDGRDVGSGGRFDGVQDKVVEIREHIDGMDDGVVTGSKVDLWTPIAADLGSDGTFSHESSGRGL